VALFFALFRFACPRIFTKLRNGTPITAAINPLSVEGRTQIVDSAFAV